MSLLNRIMGFVRDENGAALLEYTVLLGLMLVTVIAAIVSIAGWVSNNWTTLSAALTG